MDYKKYVLSYQGSKLTAIISSSLLGVMVLCNLILGFSLLTKKESVVLVPPHLTSEVKVIMNKTTLGYAKAWGLFLAELLGNVTPQNLKFIRASLEPLLDPNVYQQFINVIELQTQQISVDHISMRFEPKVVQYEEENSLIFVTGQGIIIGPTGDEKRIERTYEFKIKMKDFRPLLTWVDMYQGNARTKKVRERMQKNEEKLRQKAKEED